MIAPRYATKTVPLAEARLFTLPCLSGRPWKEIRVRRPWNGGNPIDGYANDGDYSEQVARLPNEIADLIAERWNAALPCTQGAPG